LVASNAITLRGDGEDTPSLTYHEAFSLATLGGASVVGHATTLGNFQVGKHFDAILVDPLVKNSPFDTFNDWDTTLDVFQKFLLLGDDRNMIEVYVNGRKVKPFSDD